MSVGRLRHRVASTIVERRLWEAGDRVAVAVSGGRDSTCLLDLLHLTAGIHGARLEVATVDHGTRPSARADADAVWAHARSLGLPVTRVALGLGPHATEATCREARFAALGRLSVDRIALGHHEADQAETVLLGLMRGSGTRGLAGMAWRRERWVRPLLAVSPDELDAWARWRGLRWREDPTNDDPRFLRNRVRQELLPLLDALRPGAVRALARGAALSAADADLLDVIAQAEDPWDGGWPVAWIASGPSPLVRRALLRRIPDGTAAHVDAVRAIARRGRGRLDLPGGSQAVVDGERVLIVGAVVGCDLGGMA